MNKVILFLSYSALFLISLTTKAQSTQKADELMKEYKYAEAIQELKPLADKGNIQAIRRIAECYRKINDFVNAEKFYSIVVTDKNTNKKNWFYYAQILMNNNKYEQAEKWLKDYQSTQPKDSVIVKSMLESCQNVLQKTAAYRKVKLENFQAINSTASDFCAIDVNGNILFTSTRQGKINAYDGMSYSKVYIAKKNNDTSYTIEQLKGAINSKSFNSGPATVHLPSNKIYYTKNNVQYGDAIKNKKGDVTLKIFESTFNDDNVKDFKELAFNDVEYSCAYPSINQEGNKIFFTSDRAGGYGGKDIYYSVFVNGNWSRPKNAGKNINTPGDERYPFVHIDGTLYFSSTGHQGFGGMDIFKSTLDSKGEYTLPENLGSPINTSTDDFGFYLDSNYAKGYVSSNRLGGKGSDDIYIFYYEDIPVKYTILANNEPIDSVQVTVLNLSNNSEQNQYYTNSKGVVEFFLLPNQSYSIEITKENLKPKTIELKTTTKLKPVVRNIYLEE